MITLYSILLTMSVYYFARFLAAKYSSPLTSPVFISTVIIIIFLVMSNVSYDEYIPAKNIMTYLLGPATIALAVPIYKNRLMFAKYFVAAIMGLSIGIITTITSAILLAKCFQFSKDFTLALTVKSVTVPVATEIGKIIHGNISLIVAYVIITGMIGAMFGAKLLNMFKVDHPFARGLSIGTIAHGIGTAEAVKEGEIQGAVAGAAMGIAAVFTSFIIPYLIPLMF
ncbi:LrgB family protein [Neobacillus vireti]|uniref:LrgB family protein n=1 Tax=Neobacillus vireti LMG 21834 TaxID=1131730 RepID=A0AB94IJZ3_9BACI|nr:LrgB family protein [Neobacillus vireti]ETI67386.1 LrgB family protein [Neobacillus vireti LMG 21834]KLT17355.1 membrane protein [Neobacillus vireti]